MNMEATFTEHLSCLLYRVVTIYVKGILNSGFSGFILDVNDNCVTLLSLNSFRSWKSSEQIFYRKIIVVIPIDKITSVVSYNGKEIIPVQQNYQEEKLIHPGPSFKLSSSLIIGIIAFLIFRNFRK